MTNTASLFEQEINEVCEKYNVEVSGFGIELIRGLAKNCKNAILLKMLLNKFNDEELQEMEDFLENAKNQVKAARIAK